MRPTITAPLFIAVALMSAGTARAERQPTLDEALAATFQDDSSSSQAEVQPKTCRTLADLGRRSRRATVCMAHGDWDALVKAARLPTTGRTRPIKLSSAARARDDTP